ncbi:MAG: hydrolase TatD [Desulfobulbaceae bacterium A2]|nr:MAG: hydrolase TatD [Desulfobulbaceae bacterium A2]
MIPAEYSTGTDPLSPLIDTHCHLDMEDYAPDLPAVLARAAAAGVCRIVTIGIDLASSRRAVELAAALPQLCATIGIHPHHVAEADDGVYDALTRLAADAAALVVGYGEIGLDYAKPYAPPELQRRHFSRQLRLARDLALPVVIHDREAHEDCLTLLHEVALPAGGVMHCFSGDIDFARRVLDLGLFISIPGIITFINAVQLHEVARSIPLDRMLLETDGPFLAPVPRRGKRNEPALLPHIARTVAQLRGESPEEIARCTTANARRLFRLPELADHAG